MLSYVVLEDGRQLVTLALEPAEFAQALMGHVEIPLEQLGEMVEHLAPVTVILCGPAGRERLLREAVEQRDRGIDVRYRGRPGIPDE